MEWVTRHLLDEPGSYNPGKRIISFLAKAEFTLGSNRAKQVMGLQEFYRYKILLQPILAVVPLCNRPDI